MDPEFIADPYPYYYRLRVTDPMHLTPLGLYIVSRHSDVTEILRDKRFGKDFIGRMTRRSGPQILEEPVYRSMSHWMLLPIDHFFRTVQLYSEPATIGPLSYAMQGHWTYIPR